MHIDTYILMPLPFPSQNPRCQSTLPGTKSSIGINHAPESQAAHIVSHSLPSSPTGRPTYDVQRKPTYSLLRQSVQLPAGCHGLPKLRLVSLSAPQGALSNYVLEARQGQRPYLLHTSYGFTHSATGEP